MTDLEALKKPEQEPEISKSTYELTLSEFPIFILSKRPNKDIKAIVYEDTIIGKDHLPVTRKWKVLPDAEHGFGTASTFETLYDLFQIWKESNFTDQSIQFGSIYNLIKKRGQSIGRQQYNQIIRDLNCLVGIRITAKNAFWDNTQQAYVDMTFHLFDQLDLYKDKPNGQATLPLTRIKASDVLYGSIKKNSLLTADFDSQFFHSLTPIEQRIALYLSKVLKTKKSYSREMLKLAEQIPIHSQQAKHIKQEFKKACSGLISKGFKLMDHWEFKKANDGKTELIVFYRSGTPSTQKPKEKGQYHKENYQIECLVEDILEVCNDVNSINYYKKVARCVPDNIIYRAIAEVKETSSLGEVKKNTGSIFTHLIKKYAAEQGINL